MNPGNVKTQRHQLSEPKTLPHKIIIFLNKSAFVEARRLLGLKVFDGLNVEQVFCRAAD